jgi:CRISPR/Cas system-associated protein Csm6
MEIHIHHHHHAAFCEAKLDEVLIRLKKMEASMHEDFLALAAQIDTATNAIAARLTANSQLIKNSMTDAEVAQVKTAFQADIDRLTALGKDPNNPVPPG